jgi:DNA-binding NarL/FixJ family response regulator
MKPITALLVMSGERRAAVLEQVEGCGVHVLVACGLKEARGILDTRAVDLILTDAALSDGDWRDILAHRVEAGLNSEVIVCAKRLERGLCAEAYALGAWEVVADTGSREDLRKTIESAASRNYMHSLDAGRRAAQAGVTR